MRSNSLSNRRLNVMSFYKLKYGYKVKYDYNSTKSKTVLTCVGIVALAIVVRALASARGSVVTQKKKKKKKKKTRSLEGPKGPRVAETCESEGPKGPRTS